MSSPQAGESSSGPLPPQSTSPLASPPAPAPAELQARLRAALDAGAVAGTWYWDVAGDRFTGDRRFARYLGLDPARLERGVPVAEMQASVHADDLRGVVRQAALALAAGGAYRSEFRIRLAGGAYRWVEATGQVALDGQGRAATCPGVLLDCEQRKLAQLQHAALLELGDRLRTMEDVHAIGEVAAELCGSTLAACRAGYGAVDALAGTVHVSVDWRRDDRMSSIGGLHRFRDFGSYIDDLWRGEVVAIDDVSLDRRTAPTVQALMDLRIHALLNVPLMRDGELKAIFLVHDDRPRAWTTEELAFVRGVADRTWAAMAAAEALDQLRRVNSSLEREVHQRTQDRNLLWQLSRDLTLIAASDGTITAINPAWRRVLGWPDAALIGQNFFGLVHADDLERSHAAAAALRAGASLSSFDNRFRHKDGSYRWISWSVTVDGELFVAAGRDVSDAKALELAEEQLRQSQKMEAVGQLTGGVAHDFNNLLTVISTSVALLRRAETSDVNRVRSLEAISRTVTRAAKLTGQLLAFARRQALTPVVFDAAQNVLAIADMVSALVGARIEVETSMDEGCFVHADSSQFDTAIINLVVNARDAMSGAGRLSVSVRRSDAVPAVRTHRAKAGAYVAVAITDTGSGIDSGKLDRIFEPFYTTKPVGLGTGLGLSQVFGFAKQSGGEIVVRSELGQGSTFTLYFPLASPVAKAAAEPLGTAPASVSGATVLVVEDNAEVAAAVVATLGELGYRTVLARNAASALNEIDHGAERFAAVFSDIVMAGMDGLALAREIRRQHPALPIILTTGYSDALTQDDQREFELLPKPYELHQLARRLQQVLQASPAAGAPTPDPALQPPLGTPLRETPRRHG